MDTPTPPPKPKSFFHQAAKLSWICPLLIFLLLMVGKQLNAPLAIDLIGVFLMVLGLVFGIVALFGISKHGVKGILFQAAVGITINGLLLFIFITNFMAARARALQQHGGREAAPQMACIQTVKVVEELTANLHQLRAMRGDGQGELV